MLQHPVYRGYAQQLLSIPTKSVGPVGLLYVGQRELAAAAPHDKNINIIGTDDATTCIIVVVRHSGQSKLLFIMDTIHTHTYIHFVMVCICMLKRILDILLVIRSKRFS